MKTLKEYILEEGWKKHSTITGAETIENYTHDDSVFTLSLKNNSFMFHSSWKMINISTEWIKFHTLEHFNIFDSQTRVLDGMILKYLK